MRIARLDLKAYGHFTDKLLEFPGAPDFHIVYGPNEAGKTTMSRALRAALFGFHKSTTDDFKHAYANLRVGVVLESGDGEHLAAMRRKAIKNSLIKYDPATGIELGDAIPDDVLPRWMGGLTEGLWGSMFGLDHDELVAGGKALSEGEGEVGQSLFEAGAGLTSIRTLREQLKGDADRLFRPQARTLLIHQTLNEYAAAKKEAKDAQTRPGEWDTLRKAAEAARLAYEGAREQQGVLQLETRRLERLIAVLPDIAARDLVLKRLDELGEVRRLEADAKEKRIAAETRLQQAEDALADANDDATRHQKEFGDVPRAPAVIVEGNPIEAIYHSIKSFREACDAVAVSNSTIKLTGQKTTELAGEIDETLRDDLRAVIPGDTQRARVQGFEVEGQTIKMELRKDSETKETTQAELRDLTEKLNDLGVQAIPASLQSSLRAFDSDGNPETKAAELARQTQTQQSSLDASAKALSDKGLDAVVAITTPLPAELKLFREAQAEQDSQRAVLANNIKTLENDQGLVSGEIEGLMQGGEVPTAEHLAEKREWRDGLWQRIRRKVFPDGKESQEPLPTSAEYEMSVQAADGTADARFVNAARVSQHADLVKRQAQMRNMLELELNRLAETKRNTDELKEQWQSLLARHGLPVLGVAEITEWIAKREGLIDRYQAYIDIKAQAAVAAQAVTTMRASLSAALVEAGLQPCVTTESLGQTIARAREYAGEAGEAAANAKLLARQKAQAEVKLADAERKIGEHKQALADWRTNWGLAMAGIRLDANALGTEATARLAQFDKLKAALDDLDDAHRALEAAQVTVTRTKAETKRICAAIGYDADERPTEAVIETLYERLTTARAADQLARSLTERIETAARDKTHAERAITAAKEELTALMAVAGRQSLPELVEAEYLSADLIKFERDLAEIDARLVQVSALSLPELLDQAKGQDIVQVRATLDRAGTDLEVAVTQVQDLHVKLLTAKAALDKIDGTAQASAAEQRAAEAAARLSTLIGDYASARLASAILSDVIESYQERHQEPMLARASELFGAITGGKFTRVAADFEEEKRVLVVVRDDGRRERIPALSSGRRDQLFLALRLAAIESHVASQGPVPVVVDDIVINFDDAAASATFKVLAELSQKTQVLFFTHHEHLLERAENALGTGNFKAHAL